ncbi:CHAT domain-containing protein [Paraburkholderia sp. UYCP14C]|uniref:CHAT domain-containing protein n=1 Tax=Paraburkholderia sp. UYCP14C TaxID=2511130 RepID=UPI00145A0204|nr:CHAT domain-containing protein [Paraburkholderia sp. UYCP14C]
MQSRAHWQSRLIASLALLSLCASCASGPNQESATPSVSRTESTSAGSPPTDELLVEQQLSTISDGAQRYALLDKLSTTYFREGRVADSMRIREKIVYDSHIPAGQRSLAASDLANSYAIASDFVHSDRMLQQAKSLARSTSPSELEQLRRNPAYFELYVESEFERRYLNRQDLALSARRTLISLTWRDLNDPSLSEHQHRMAVTELFGDDLSEVIRTMVENNRRMEALSYANELRWIMQTRPDLHLSAFQRGEVDYALAIALSSNDDYDAAMVAISAALEEFRNSDLSPNTVTYSEARRARLLIALVQGRIGDYAADADGWESAAAVNPVVAKNEGTGERASLILASRGQWKAAEDKISAAMIGTLRRYGAGSPFYKSQAALKVLYELSNPGSDVTAEQLIKYASEIVGSPGSWDASSIAGPLVVDGALELSMKRLMAGTDTDQRMAFRIAEFFHTNATYGAMADGAARLAATNPALRTLVEQEQEARYQQNTARLALTLAVSQLSSSHNGGTLLQQSAAASAVKREQSALGEVDKHLASIRKQIEKEFPAYKELVAPELPDPATLSSTLRQGEVYIDLYAARDEGYAFVVRPEGTFKAVRLSTARAGLKKQIIALRAAFDSGSPPTRTGDPGGFNLAASVSLYEALIAPIADELRGAKTAYIVTSGPLASTPFDVLVTEPTENLESAKWWISSIAPVRLPSGSALVIARAHPSPNASQPFIAFADPSFSGAAAGAATEKSEDVTAAAASNPAQLHFDYRRVAPLPETLDEARSIATALDAPRSSIVSGTQATRSSVLKADLSTERVVLFATHGVIPGELPEWHKSGLALAYEGNGLLDSILSADDIVTLRLNADWVVLSACNTGLASGNAGDAVSELSRAFFAAGARTMLVTQWAVESRSAADVTTAVFRTFASDPSLSKAEALAQTERNMLNGKVGVLYRHPYYWGAYVLNGDGAR